ncbi:hypothetical protein TUM19329_20360 [Legionella antarctica]|uniref:Uncharacterized protein n=1 Tax=Legionella antarctica TaxID=2708020 RepID=A0A6F8T4R0_9GAMM|nr:hypothetical protein [Legionella antarctica]BCA95675.1 hypothetical protein TUM19329_20360 [Legionella antarctica]
MFAKKENSNKDTILKYLANAYRCYENAEWNYSQADAGVGGFLVDGCITSIEKFKSIVNIIGQGLIEENEDASKASLLFEKLYKNGFKDGQYHESIQDKFKEILPQKSIERLDESVSMADCLKSIYISEQVMAFTK